MKHVARTVNADSKVVSSDIVSTDGRKLGVFTTWAQKTLCGRWIVPEGLIDRATLDLDRDDVRNDVCKNCASSVKSG